MENKYFEKISAELRITAKQVEGTITLLDDGATVPFIARYRKEMTGSIDEVAITTIRDRVEQLRELDKRRESIIGSLIELGKLSNELKEKIEAAETMTVLEDLYLPYKPKRRTRATIAKEKGLEPLADFIWEQSDEIDLMVKAREFINPKFELNTVEQVLAGTRDILAEKINENQQARTCMRDLFERQGTFKAKVIAGKEEEGKKYEDYFELEEPIAKAPSHRVLAMRRAEKEMIISLEATPKEENAIQILEYLLIKQENATAEQIRMAIKESYKRLLCPSIETEIRSISKKRADEEAIRVFMSNLRELLLSSPLGQKAVLGIDPAFRTGCKIVVLDPQGKLLHDDVIYPHEPQRKVAESSSVVKWLVDRYKVQAVAIGNGTASRETEQFIRSLKMPIPVVMVNESGASVYSASDIAREEFPNHDITVRGAVSIGRRLMDPLSELVKIDPKAIGVGQYQHDVDQNALKKSLDDVVMSCVNAVGVEVNTASKEILTYVSGLGDSLAQNIVNYRNENGEFKNREELKKVARMGAKSFEQCAGFLRIRNSTNPLDMSAVHPESYHIVQRMAKDLGADVEDLMKDETLREEIQLNKYVTERTGLPTLKDILQELAKPGRDPREKFEPFSFAEGVTNINDLKVGMRIPGIVTNVTNFGAFVDVGVHQDGLLHLSQISDKFVRHPSELLKAGQKLLVTVIHIDLPKKRISLSTRLAPMSNEERVEKQRKESAEMQDKLSMLQTRFKR